MYIRILWGLCTVGCLAWQAALSYFLQTDNLIVLLVIQLWYQYVSLKLNIWHHPS